MVLRHDFEQWQAAALMVTEMSSLKHEPFYSVGDEGMRGVYAVVYAI